MPRNNTSARVAPPADGQNSFFIWFSDVVDAVVYTVSVAVCAAEPLIVTEAGTMHVAGWLAAVGVMAQLRLTVPVNAYDGVTVIVEVLPLVEPCITVMLPLLARAKLGVPTLTVTMVVCVMDPDVPVTVTVYAPAVVVEVVLTVSVAVCAVELLIVTEAGTVHVAGLVAPVGPTTAQVRSTVPVNAPKGVTVMVEVLPVVAPGLTVMLPLLLRKKLVEPTAEPLTTAVIPSV